MLARVIELHQVDAGWEMVHLGLQGWHSQSTPFGPITPLHEIMNRVREATLGTGTGMGCCHAPCIYCISRQGQCRSGVREHTPMLSSLPLAVSACEEPSPMCTLLSLPEAALSVWLRVTPRAYTSGKRRRRRRCTIEGSPIHLPPAREQQAHRRVEGSTPPHEWT